MAASYDEVRRPEYGSIGDSYRLCERDPAAFVAGAQYVLDRLNNRSSGPVELLAAVAPGAVKYLDTWSAEILTRALNCEPQ